MELTQPKPIYKLSDSGEETDRVSKFTVYSNYIVADEKKVLFSSLGLPHKTKNEKMDTIENLSNIETPYLLSLPRLSVDDETFHAFRRDREDLVNLRTGEMSEKIRRFRVASKKQNIKSKYLHIRIDENTLEILDKHLSETSKNKTEVITDFINSLS